MSIKNLAYDSAFTESNIYILPFWIKATSGYLTKIVHRSPCLFPSDSGASLGTFFSFFLTLFSLVGIWEPVQRKHLKAENFLVSSENLESASTSEDDERGIPKV